MIRSVLFLFLFAAAGLAEHEDVVDTILASISQKFQNTSAPFYVSTMNQNIKSVNVKVTLTLKKGVMSLKKLERNGDVTYSSSSDEDATFKFKSTLETSTGYSYGLASTSSDISSGIATADWKSEVDMVVTATTQGCELKMTDVRNTQNFDIHFDPYELTRFPLTIHYPVGDVVETKLIPTLNAALNKALSGWTICEIFPC